MTDRELLELAAKAAGIGEMKKSPWVPITTNPAHVGFYQIRGWLYEGGIYAHWDGSRWGFWLDDERKYRVHFPEHENDQWRGKL